MLFTDIESTKLTHKLTNIEVYQERAKQTIKKHERKPTMEQEKKKGET